MFTVLVSLLLSLIRGEDFHVAFNHISDLCSTVPPKVHIIALTATATAEVLRTVTGKLCLENPIVIGLTPNTENINIPLKHNQRLKYFVNCLQKTCIICVLIFQRLVCSAPLLNVSQYINTKSQTGRATRLSRLSQFLCNGHVYQSMLR